MYFDQIFLFIDYIRLYGFNIGVAHYLRIQELLLTLTAQRQTLTANQLKRFLGPIVCQSKKEQDDFSDLFDRWFNSLSTEFVMPESNDPTLGSSQNSIKSSTFKRSKQRYLAWLFVIIIVVSLIVLLLSLIEDPTGAQPETFTGLLALLIIIGTLLIFIPAVSLLIFLIGSAVFYHYARIERRIFNQPIESMTANLTAYEGSIFVPQYISRLSQKLISRNKFESQKIDIQQSVKHTVRQGGWLTPKFHMRKSLPEYFFLIDRVSFRDHQSSFIEDLIQQLKKHNIVIRSFYFNGSPFICHQDEIRDPVLSLDELIMRAQNKQILLFMDSNQCYDPITGKLMSWVSDLTTELKPILVTPKPPEEWEATEFDLWKHIKLVPATRDGLLLIKQQLVLPAQQLELSIYSANNVTYPPELSLRPRRWLEEVPVESSLIKEVLEQLQNHLGSSGFYWLCACAVFPQLHWPLTLYLGAHLYNQKDEILLSHNNLLKLIQLPWFRYGYMPTWFRFTLLNKLDESQKNAIQVKVNEVLATLTFKGFSKLQIDVALWFGPLTHHLLQRFSDISDKLIGDYIFVSFMAQLPLRQLIFKLPRVIIQSLSGQQLLRLILPELDEPKIGEKQNFQAVSRPNWKFPIRWVWVTTFIPIFFGLLLTFTSLFAPLLVGIVIFAIRISFNSNYLLITIIGILASPLAAITLGAVIRFFIPKRYRSPVIPLVSTVSALTGSVCALLIYIATSTFDNLPVASIIVFVIAILVIFVFLIALSIFGTILPGLLQARILAEHVKWASEWIWPSALSRFILNQGRALIVIITVLGLFSEWNHVLLIIVLATLYMVNEFLPRFTQWLILRKHVNDSKIWIWVGMISALPFIITHINEPSFDLSDISTLGWSFIILSILSILGSIVQELINGFTMVWLITKPKE